MNKRPLRKITLSDMREIVDNTHVEGEKMFFMSKNFGIGTGLSSIFRKIMTIGEPLLIDDCRIGIIKKGEADITVNLIDYKIKPGTLAYVGSGNIVQINHVSDDFDIQGFVLRDEFMSIALHGHVPAIFNGERMHVYINATEQEQSIVERIIHTIWDVVHQKEYSRETVYSLVAALLHYYDSLSSSTLSAANKTYSREREVFERFIALVNKHCHEQHTLAYYAGQLCLTDRYLGSLVKQASGATAKEWIDRAVITKAKVMLRHTDKQVAQISDELHFSNNSFFCKFFKRITGKTPLDYRNS